MRLIATEEAVSFAPIAEALNAHCLTSDDSLDMTLVRMIYGDGGERGAMVKRLTDVTDERIADMMRTASICTCSR